MVPTVTGDHENRITDYTAIVCYAIDSHPMDGRFRISEGGVPSVTAKLAKMAADGPLVLIKCPPDNDTTPIVKNYTGGGYSGNT